MKSSEQERVSPTFGIAFHCSAAWAFMSRAFDRGYIVAAHRGYLVPVILEAKGRLAAKQSSSALPERSGPKSPRNNPASARCGVP